MGSASADCTQFAERFICSNSCSPGRYPQSSPDSIRSKSPTVIFCFRASAMRGAFFREKRQHGLIEPDQLLSHGDAGQHRGNRLGHRRQVVRRRAVIRKNRCIGHDIPMTDHQQTVNSQMFFGNLIDRVGQRFGIEALRLRRCCPPFLGGPVSGSLREDVRLHGRKGQSKVEDSLKGHRIPADPLPAFSIGNLDHIEPAGITDAWCKPRLQNSTAPRPPE